MHRLYVGSNNAGVNGDTPEQLFETIEMVLWRKKRQVDVQFLAICAIDAKILHPKVLKLVRMRVLLTINEKETLKNRTLAH